MSSYAMAGFFIGACYIERDGVLTLACAQSLYTLDEIIEWFRKFSTKAG